jgi:hypothetical protein
MSQQTQAQKDADALTKNAQAFGTGQKKVDATGFKTPAVGQAMKDDNQAAKIAAPARENDAVEAPVKTNVAAVQADAKRDATPMQKPTLVNTDQSDDTE